MRHTVILSNEARLDMKKAAGYTFIQFLLLIIVAAVFLSPATAAAQAPEIKQPTVFITGANRGIGFALARQYAERGWGVERYRGVPIDILINNAGILGDNDKQKFGTFDYSAFDQVMAVNTRGPIKIVEAFIDNVTASDQQKIMNISSYVGSIERTFGGQNFYRASKAALNMSMATIARELKYSKIKARKTITVGLIDPGVVDTGFAGELPIPMIPADESAAGVIAVIDAYTPKETGTFIRYDGKPIPW